jgi:hydrogenase maturation protease
VVRIVVACFGNVLRGDDGFGVVVAERLLTGWVPDEVEVLDVGIGGIHLVQELLEPADALVAVDAVDLGRPPGTVVVMEPEVAELSASTGSGRDALADMHYANPQRALMLAEQLGQLPAWRVLIGCQTAAPDALGEGLSPAAASGVEPALGELRRVVSELGVAWEATPTT